MAVKTFPANVHHLKSRDRICDAQWLQFRGNYFYCWDIKEKELPTYMPVDI